MRLRPLSIAGVFAIVASVAQAQTSTADGVEAFVRGDYQRAAEILQPLAEAPRRRDHVAEFFMATLYENGHGVPPDLVRACALYARAASGGPFEQQAHDIFRAFLRSMGMEDLEDCIALSNVGLGHRFSPVTFILEPGHWVALDLRGAVVTHEGKEKRTDIGLATSGAVHLAVEHTELTVGRTRSTRRHFIEVFTWYPAAVEGWSLIWRVVEVVRDDIATVVAEEVMTLAADEPPTRSSIDIRELARLGVNDAGDAEWSVLSGPNARTRDHRNGCGETGSEGAEARTRSCGIRGGLEARP